jgi:hypothetical protein
MSKMAIGRLLQSLGGSIPKIGEAYTEQKKLKLLEERKKREDANIRNFLIKTAGGSPNRFQGMSTKDLRGAVNMEQAMKRAQLQATSQGQLIQKRQREAEEARQKIRDRKEWDTNYGG